MAKKHSKSQSRSAKDISTKTTKQYPYHRKLKVLESLAEPRKKSDLAGVHYQPVTLKPCVILKGLWFEQAGFAIGEHVDIKVRKKKLIITPLPQAASETPASEL